MLYLGAKEKKKRIYEIYVRTIVLDYVFLNLILTGGSFALGSSVTAISYSFGTYSYRTSASAPMSLLGSLILQCNLFDFSVFCWIIHMGHSLNVCFAASYYEGTKSEVQGSGHPVLYCTTSSVWR